MKKIIKKKNQAHSDSEKFPSELRLDLIAKDWVVIATGRARRPETFKKEKRFKEESSDKTCPFDNIQTQLLPTLVFSKGKEIPFTSWEEILPHWTTIVIPNKYPAFTPHSRLERRIEGGLYQTMNAVGFHEVVVTRDHKRQLADFSLEEIKELFDVYQKRYLSLQKEKFVNYISIFHNQGATAGASVAHPHSQIITTPLIDVDLQKALFNAQRYYDDNKECVYCRLNRWELKSRKRIVFENPDFLAVCPFASKTAFEVIISPKAHRPYFEKIQEQEKFGLAEAFGTVIKKICKGLANPDYNFYLHTAPGNDESYDFYHWHWTILPRTSIWAGFEIGSRMEVSTIEPERAAAYLRKQ